MLRSLEKTERRARFARSGEPSARRIRASVAVGFVRRASILFLLACAVSLSSASCRVFEPSNKPLDGCRRSCEKKAKEQCNAALCERGCEMILDRIVEGEGERVIECVASGPRRCTDVVWADCASRVGVHADGGPPGPPPPPEDE